MTSNEDLDPRVILLRQAIEFFREELSTLSGRRWEDLPELKKKKVVLAGRFRGVDWPSDPALKAFQILTGELESQSRHQIQGQLNLLEKQIIAMQDLRQYWRESLSVSLQRFYEPAATP